MMRRFGNIAKGLKSMRYFLAFLALLASPLAAQTAAVPAPPIVTAPAKDFGGNGQIAYGSKRNVRALQAMDAFPLSTNGVIISDIVLDKGRMFATPKKSAALTINDVTIERISANVTKRGIFVRGDSARWTIRDFDIRYVGSTDTNDYPMGIQLGMSATETPHDILIERGYIAGFKNARPSGYPNADGIDCERGVRNVTIRDVVIEDITDGAVDCKATNVRLENVTARNVSHRSFRLWGTGTASTLTSVNPGWAHIWISGNGGSYVIDKLVAIGGGALVQSEKGAKLVIKACDLTGWTGKVKNAGGGSVQFGAGC
ncbi:hypothetical protein [Novosphingobium olei]|uniref:hypothetical protein n=1 Tax=Novosphingobium olei TaxID=2728851 RepID=UPI00308C3077|nr:hypothetical protein NSDW_32790 [Novosphingobium olei]